MSNKTTEILIKNGLVVAEGVIRPADILVQGETIAAVAPPFTLAAEREIDASGKYIFPGIIDAHVHPIYLDDKYDTSVSAAFGGVTSMIHYVYVKPGESLLSNLQTFRDD